LGRTFRYDASIPLDTAKIEFFEYPENTASTNLEDNSTSETENETPSTSPEATKKDLNYLKSYLCSHGITSTDGKTSIAKQYDSEVIEIYYNTKTDSLGFSMVVKYNLDYDYSIMDSIELIIPLNSPHKGSVKFLYSFSETAIDATTTIYVDQYTKSTILNFVILTYGKNYPGGDTKANQLCNNILKSSMVYWYNILNEDFNMTMHDVGFINYP